MDVLDMPVTLIVKAPNQQIEDQTIKCEPTWTIKRLKGYLSEVYPSKPRTEDQKLIYSGQLLSDSVVLRDILRWYEGQEAHTVHLVCTPSKEQSSKTQSKMSDCGSKQATVPSSGSEDVRTSASSTMVEPDGLRQRSVGSASSTSLPQAATSSSNSGLAAHDRGHVQIPTLDPRAAWAAAMAQPYVSTAPFSATGGALDPNNMVQQMAWVQQAYAYYMTQYMQMLASGPAVQNNYGQAPNGIQTDAYTQPVAEEPAAAAVPNNQQEQAIDGNLIGGDDDDRANRDWLYWIYFLSRVMVLFSIVYFYSSPTRFIIVSALGIIMYLYQIGFFRVQAPAAIPQPAPPPAPVPENNNVVHAGRDIVRHGNVHQLGEEAAAPAPQRDGDSDTDERAVQEPERPSLLAITWTFFSSFFASLIPEQPGPL
ncbi:homocysteine-responsive endoplasmic reticulum-resident ubiquitin-like domain member 2 protein [Schistocerca cancellata]|uniref:homocysteine-responsive endoplasmic reticulum-resident ubiquitin-like domain member 2 protein n=1 Tax=Schistocerca cancellata TaxID=274614 RepID=UPI0021191F88|nr:homocysteine-responsive endoplasmic reticulum-resident ubiquitin-like domain member 2 protein [Schistocerca cancellata]XP_049787356.1 homocysteine-responsive endoplasmic reticulum-resident ubiquitin-like domain member 2 protein [Schistocerca cancellata]XP_049787358.1 homocysteine-responsive endoplasmic reticulum-resident ubiquitin-like domain member 2 protein [Schistocerca cancellata]XP_049787359.1 homocysteine-responsive endoplasmic reticulum-resident ubiquitin-like domain member 2 protein [